AFGAPGDDLADLSEPSAAFPVAAPSPPQAFTSAPAAVAASPAPTTAPKSTAPRKAAAPVVLSTAPAASYPDKVPGGWVVIGVIGAILAGLGLHQIRNKALTFAAAGSTCPLERGTS